jgi:hypothetical protein
VVHDVGEEGTDPFDVVVGFGVIKERLDVDEPKNRLAVGHESDEIAVLSDIEGNAFVVLQAARGFVCCSCHACERVDVMYVGSLELCNRRPEGWTEFKVSSTETAVADASPRL